MLLTLSKKKCDIFKFTDCIKSDSEKRDCENIVYKKRKKKYLKNSIEGALNEFVYNLHVGSEV